MNLEITGKVINVLPVQSGTSKNGNEWVKNSFVIQTQGEYPKMVCFSVMGRDRWEKMNIQVGMTYNVSFDAESREWNSKFFTELTAWKAVSISGGQQQPRQAQAPEPAPAQGVSPFPTADAQPSGDADSLPF